MIDMIKDFFSKSTDQGIQAQGKDRTHDITVATCALLLEISQIDGQFSEQERDHIMTVLKRNFGLSDEFAGTLIETAAKELEGSVDLWKFTNLINKNYSPEEKIAVIETIWRIAYTDGRLDKHEDYLMHKLANLLRIDHRQLIEAKLKAKGRY